jgi:hypothetical protein
MPSECVELSAGNSIPNANSFIIGSRYNMSSIRRKSHRINSLRMSPKCAEFYPSNSIPSANCFVIGSRHNLFSIKGECNRVNWPEMICGLVVVKASQIRTVLSEDPDRTHASSRENATE